MLSDQYLPPIMPGFEDLELYPPDGSGLEEARALMRGRTVTAVLAIPAGNDHSRQEAEVVRSNLAQIGITVEFQELVTFRPLFRNPDVEIDLMGAGVGLYYADPATFLWDMLVSDYYMPASWLPKGSRSRWRGSPR